MKVYFIDTNIFLQCKDLTALPWKDFLENEDVLILVSRPVQDEIDRFKGDGKTRRSKKAKKASSMFREIIKEGGERKLASVKDNTVRIAFSPTIDPKIIASEELDLSRPDDKLINEALIYKEHHKDQRVFLLSNDTGPMLTSKRVGLDFIEIPEEWVLEPEHDARDKELFDLKRRIGALEKNIPIIQVIVSDKGEKEISGLDQTVKLYGTLEDDELDRILNLVKNTYPIETDFGEKEPPNPHAPSKISQMSSLGFLEPKWEYKKPSSNEIEAYKNKTYPEWLDKIKETIRKAPQEFERFHRMIVVEIEIANIGNAPAEKTIFEVETLGGLLLFKPNEDDQAKLMQLQMREPPKPPKGEWIRVDSISLRQQMSLNGFRLDSISDRHSRFEHIHIPKERDEHGFYWRSDGHEIPTKKWELECREFRHRIEGNVFKVGILIPPEKQSGAIRCRITAKNLPQPKELTIPVKISYEQGDSENIILELINKGTKFEE